MILKAVEISLIITAIHISMWDGMIFFKIRLFLSNLIDKCKLEVLKNPLFDCLTCMGGVWTLILFPMLFRMSLDILPIMLMVITLNTLIDKYLQHD